jgi:hypothetical protein
MEDYEVGGERVGERGGGGGVGERAGKDCWTSPVLPGTGKVFARAAPAVKQQ